MARITFWFEFASTYSYPAAMRIEELAEASEVEVTWRPFLLGPIFNAQGWATSPFNLYPAKGANMWRDLERTCAELKIPFKRPTPFPQNGLLAARIATYGLSRAWGVAFTKAVYRTEFGDGQSIDSPTVLKGLVADAGGDADAACQGALTEINKLALKQATDQAIALGVFGAPSFVTDDGELFWGNDRLEQALCWAVSSD
ncbi:MAG: 2-hydroxychromene-2-carboxylate isomerase [Alphaproteobacteria bacterium]|nr:2-hydroxychromene-2-carboxylate isomerase [Alphaproteobacteria bacterium]